MAEGSWPSPNHGSPARSVTDTEYVRLAPWNSDGIFPSSSDVIYANSSGMQVHVRANKFGLVRGHAWTSGPDEYNLTIGPNTSGSTRIDTGVLRLDRSTWDVNAAVRPGTPGAGAPALQRGTGDTGLFEIPLADITVVNGAASIAAGNVRTRTLLQAGGVRVCNAIGDIQAVLTAGDIVYELTTGRWIGWTGSSGATLHEDTGYQNLTIIGNWQVGGFTPQVRLRNGWVYLRGSIVRKTNTLQSTDTNSPIATIPASYRPAGTHNWATGTSGPVDNIRLQVDAGTGALAVVGTAADIPVGRAVYLDTSWIAG